MAEESSGQEKTEEPTARRLQDARKKGDVAKSMEIPSAAVLLVGLLTIYLLSGYMLENFLNLLRHYLTHLHTINIIPGNMPVIARESMKHVALLTGPLMLTLFITALVANYAQVGVLFSTEKIEPKLEKIDPIKGVGRIFSMQTLANTVKSIAKLVIVGFVAYKEIMKNLDGIIPLMDQDAYAILVFYAKVSFWIFLKAALIIAVLAALDYAFQRWQFMNKMKMTKQEVKEEAKMTEGDPHVKGRIRSLQMQMARKRMMTEVPKADVIITNPTHLALALAYDKQTMIAPTVIAKGAGVIAGKIKEVARAHNIPIIEDKPLAQALYKAVEINEQIPENLFQAVAEILAYVYGLKKKSA
ncbi:MAG: flagellar biosynthesis protein FlhB [Proteobacteria bacterium]|nr:flagellar biosynthesis protein FlhB [Pseudomonadota bacterium]MBU4297256.1 flagellar biosynthesis protein FlhB [Pseudomonadota bacterium]MCG2747707.1 flagellar biosynthesis protein FlhB [Desulfobulbaceae bacterium]